jgi:hypothetical protein
LGVGAWGLGFTWDLGFPQRLGISATESYATISGWLGYRSGAVTDDDFQYAIENTRVILAPERQIATFGSTSFRFYLISELMDQANEIRVRDGRIHAERPQILTPEHYCRLLLEGFGDKAEKYVEMLRERTRDMAVLRYGFQFRKTDVVENRVRDTMEAVVERTRRQVEHSEEPLSAVIQGVDDAWEICLLKFTIDLIERSSGGNMGDFRKRGLV